MTKFEAFVIYFLLMHWGVIKLCYIKSNRKNKKQIQSKYETCISVGMQTPALFCSPRVVSDAGYTLVDVKTDQEIPEDQVDSYDACIYEGHNRFWAWFNHLTTEADGSVVEAFQFMFIFHEFKSSDDFKKAYHEINLNQDKTTTSDFARDILATGGGNKIIVSYNKKVTRGLVAKAAGYATYNREFDKDDIKSLQQGKAPAYMSDDKILHYTDRVFEKTLETFGCFAEGSKIHKALKGSFIWKFNAEKLKAVEGKDEDLEAETKKLEKVYSTMPASSMYAISEAKATDDKTKEQVVDCILQELYDNIKD